MAKEADKGSLVSRWKKSAQASAALPGIIEALKSGGHLGAESSPFGRVGDLCDVRGLQVPDGMRILSRHVKDADFSWGFIRLAWIQNCVFENVRFDNATIDTADHGNRFTGCSFVGTSFQDGIGYRGSSYNNCRFEKVDFRRSVFTRAEMNDCIFSDCKLKGVDFNASSFVNCMFEGKLEDVWFRGGFPLPVNVTDFGEPRPNRMQGVSFANASLWGITFSNGCDLSSVVLPTTGDYRLYSSWKRRLENLRLDIDTWPERQRPRAAIFAKVYLVHAGTQDWYLLNCDDIREQYGKETGSRIIATLDRPL